MKLIKESLNEFERGADPKAALNIGKYKKVSDKLNDLYNNPNKHRNHFEYKINSLDHIEIFFNERLRNIDQDEYGAKYIMKYVELPQYVLNNYKNSYTLYDHKYNEDKLSVYKNIIDFQYWPDDKTFHQELTFHLGNYNNEEALELGDVIIEALNNKYPSIWGFELIKTIKFDETS